MTIRVACLTSALALAASALAAQEMSFNRIASFPTWTNIPEDADRSAESSAEIIAASGDGMTLVYTDGPYGALGFIDITDPAAPVALGQMATADGDPTSVAAAGNIAYAAVNTRADFLNPSGYLLALDIAGRSELARCDLGGQPDAVTLSPDGTFLAVAIENERDEEAGDGRVPQMPAGFVAILALGDDGLPVCDSLIAADLTGLADIAPEDPEPEYLDINGEGEIVVTLQENNHIVVLSREGAVLSHFSAGAVDLSGVDLTDEQAAILFTGEQPGRLREPDSIQWIDDTHFAMANEGDMDGGSRGWTILSQDGAVIYESGMSLEYALAEAGHYPDRRSDAKGIEPESITTGTFGGTPMVFVGAERASAVAVYDVTDPANPVLRQILPSGIGPEGYAVIEARGLLVSANETDLGGDALARAHVMIYQWGEGAPVYPHLTAAGMEGGPIGWAAMSGLAVDPENPAILYAVNDSFFGYQPRIFTIDVSRTPARITAVTEITRAGYPAQKLDIEGIAPDGEGGFWLASEGRTDRLIPHALYHVDARGRIRQEIPFPPELLAEEIRFGAEGVTLIDGTLWIAIQREWRTDPDNHVKLVAYNIETGDWGAVLYPKAEETGEGWVGLSEIAVHGDHVYLIERDNHTAENAVTKLVTRVPLSEMVPAPLGGDLPVVTREVVRDLIPDLAATGGFILEKIEGLAITPDGTAWVVTDNDGVNDSTGETMFWSFRIE